MSIAETASPIQSAHRQRLIRIKDEAEQLAGEATKIAQAASEALHYSSTASFQWNFVTGAYSRLAKDIGVVEYLQSLGATQRRR